MENYRIFSRDNKITALIKKTILYFLIALAVTFGVSLAIGYKYKIVATGSMEPVLHEMKTMVAIAPIDFRDVEVGDIVTWKSSDSPNAITFTHRVVEKLENGNYRTKGDARHDVDGGELTEDKFLGKVVFKSHLIGGTIIYIKNYLWQCIIAVVLFFLAYLAIC